MKNNKNNYRNCKNQKYSPAFIKLQSVLKKLASVQNLDDEIQRNK